MVKDIYPGTEGSWPATDHLSSGASSCSGRLDGGPYDYALWESDGTAAGTKLVQDSSGGPMASLPFELTKVGGELFFTAWGSISQ